MRSRKRLGRLRSPTLLSSLPLLSPLPYPHPFRNCIVLGLMLGEDGGKMSKSKRNYREPERDLRPLRGRRPAVVLLRQPAALDLDPLQRAGDQGLHSRVPAAAVERLQLLRDLRQHRRFRSGGGHVPASAGQLGPDVLADRQGLSPGAEARRVGPLDSQRTEPHGRGGGRADGRLRQLRRLRRLTEFVDALSNWYVRRSRDRFWSSGKVEDSADKSDAYWTLYECLLTTCKLIAPFVPFLAEAMWQNLAVAVACAGSRLQPGCTGSRS